MNGKKKVPMRQCVGCKEMKNKKEMMRVLKTSDDAIVLDTSGRKNGRGAYLCMTKECLIKARKNKGLSRSFKMNIPDEIYEKLEKEFEEDVQG
ncbi:MAG: YlxR family protein [Lachnospiraceae bacterium]|nr:YlxR family protein [Lachnospiraceae bacterium]